MKLILGVLRLTRRILFGARPRVTLSTIEEAGAAVQASIGAAHPGPSGDIMRAWVARLSWKQRLLLLAPAACTLAIAGSLAGLMVYYTVAFPHPLDMRSKEQSPVIRILARDGSVLAERGAAHDYMPLDLLPRHVQAAVVATEDRRFFEHYGIDPTGLIRASFTNLRAGRFVQGGSTLTQQLAKNLFLTSERTLARKIEEFALALWLELRLSKSEILELYLNRVYFGGGAYGIEAASQRYFDKTAQELTLAEAAIVAGLLKAPSKFSPANSPEAAIARSRVVLAKMVETGFIAPADARRAAAERVIFHEPGSADGGKGTGYAVDLVLERLPPLIGAGHAEIIVETTFDAALQHQADDIVAKSLVKYGTRLGASQAAVVVLDNDGGIRALVGGRDYAQSQFNRAVKAHRQPGSAFKPFVYLAALEAGMTPESIAYDLPLTIGNWSPKNDNGTYAGEVTLRRALAQSINTVAVRLNQDVGRGRTAEIARRLGIRSELREDASLALGTSEVTLLELTGAYTAFGNGGLAVEPHAIRRVRMSSGQVLFAREAQPAEQVVDPAVVGAMNDMLNATLISGTGRRAGIPDHPAAGKTGTTQDFRDAWFVGYTSHLAAGVWLGNDDGKPMNHSVGGGLPAEMWRQLMLIAHEGKAPLALPGTVPQGGAGEIAAASHAAPAAPRLPTADGQDDLPSAADAPPAVAPQSVKPALDDPKPKAMSVDSASLSAAHPKESIDEDFIARALSDISSATDGTQQAAADATPAEPVTRPGGIMSLGGWW